MPQSVVAVYFQDDSSVNLPVHRYRDLVQTRYVVLIREIFWYPHLEVWIQSSNGIEWDPFPQAYMKQNRTYAIQTVKQFEENTIKEHRPFPSPSALPNYKTFWLF